MKKNSHVRIIKNSNRIRRLTLTAMLFAVALVLTTVEGSLPPVFVSVPGVKLGLSNVVVMYALFFIGTERALVIAVLKASFVAATRGVVAGALSFSGGICSVLIMSILVLIFRERISYFILSISGALFHNVGQFATISLIYAGVSMWPYLPVLVFSAILTGFATSLMLKFIIPAFNSLNYKQDDVKK